MENPILAFYLEQPQITEELAQHLNFNTMAKIYSEGKGLLSQIETILKRGNFDEMLDYNGEPLFKEKVLLDKQRIEYNITQLKKAIEKVGKITIFEYQGMTLFYNKN